MQIRGKTFRFALNQQLENGLLDAFSNQQIRFARQNWVRLRYALFDGDPNSEANLVTDISNVVSATLTMRKTDANGDLLFQDTIPAAEFDNQALTFADWRAKSSQHFSFLLTGEETNWAMPAGNWTGAIYHVVRIDTSAEGPVTLQAGAGGVFKDGVSDAPDTVVNNPTYLTTEQSDARYAAMTIPGFYRFKAGAGLQQWNAETEKFHTMGLTGPADNLQPTWDVGED